VPLPMNHQMILNMVLTHDTHEPFTQIELNDLAKRPQSPYGCCRTPRLQIEGIKPANSMNIRNIL
jgi:hypothetical protein